MSDQDETNGAQGGADADSGSSAAGAGSSGADKAGDGARSGADTAGAKAEDTVAAADYNRIKTQLQAADRKRQEAETALKEIRDKDLPEAEKLKKDFAEIQAANQKLEADLQKARVENAFLSDNTHKWRDNRLALSNIDLSKVTVDSDGGVTGLKDALKALATQYPFMLEPKAQDGEEGDGKNTKPPAFTPPAGAGRQPDNAKQVLSGRFPAMRGRPGV